MTSVHIRRTLHPANSMLSLNGLAFPCFSLMLAEYPEPYSVTTYIGTISQKKRQRLVGQEVAISQSSVLEYSSTTQAHTCNLCLLTTLTF